MKEILRQVKETEKENNHPIDAVIAWVDGNDEDHQNKMKKYLPNNGFINKKEFITQYNQLDEIKYTVHSILKFAPFIRKIFIVTDNQIPKFLKDNSKIYEKVVIVDHTEIFKGDSKYLPVFNSISIATKLYKIPDLSENFIYFNDDVLLLKPVDPSDFFIQGKPVIRARWSRFKENVFYKNIVKKKKIMPSYVIAQEKGAKLLGFKKLLRFHHTPHPLRISTTSDFFRSNRSLETNNIKYRFKNSSQFLMIGLANHLETKNKSSFLKKDYQLIHFRNYNKPMFWLKFKLNFLSKKQKKLFLNLQSLDQCPKPKQDYIIDWLTKKYAI